MRLIDVRAALPFATPFALCLVAALAVSCTSGPGDRVTPDAGVVLASCPPSCAKCADDHTCKDCTPGQKVCKADDSVVVCNPDGTLGQVASSCDLSGGEKCAGGACISPCDIAAESHSYIGCDYWPVTTLTAQLDPVFDFAVAVANPAINGDGMVINRPAKVTVSLAGQVLVTKTIQPGAVETILLPWQSDLSQNLQNELSTLVTQEAYHLVSTQPVTVYQFSPLQYEKQDPMCRSPDLMGSCKSYTNDASILLPSTALRKDYIVVSRQSIALWPKNRFPRPAPSTTPGFFTVVGTEDHTNVTVTYSAYTNVGISMDEQKPGDVVVYQLDKGDVLQVISRKDLPASWDMKKLQSPCVAMNEDSLGAYCDLGPLYDLTGTKISADKAVEVFGGHSCSFVPYDRWACDHLEQTIYPLDTWGKEVLSVQTPVQNKGEVNYWRVISGIDGNVITFDPPVHADVKLDTAKWVEFSATGAFHVQGTGRLLLAQYMVGQNYVDNNFVGNGDPSLGLAPPTEQFRKTYDFLTPETYVESYVTVIAPTGSSYVLDKKIRSIGFNDRIGSTNWGFDIVPVDPGAHHVEADKPFGISVAGVAPFTSYLFAGGLNLLELLPQ